MTLAALACVYFGAAELGLSFAFAQPNASPVWPASGLAMAAVVILGSWAWPGIAVGAFAISLLTNLQQGLSLPTAAAIAMAIAAGNTLEAVCGAYLLRRYVACRGLFDSLRGVCRFVILAPVLATTLSATAGVFSLCLAGLAPWSRYPYLWSTWWLGDAVGILAVAPFLIELAAPGRALRRPLRKLHLLVWTALCVAVLTLVFVKAPGQVPSQSGHLEHLLIPIVVLASFCQGVRGATATTLLIAVVAVWATVVGRGPFASSPLNDALLVLQIFVAVLTTIGLAVAAVLTEHRVERERCEATMRSLVAGTMAGTGRECFDRIAAELCKWFQADCCLVGRFVHPDKVRALSMLCDGETVYDREWPLAETPLEVTKREGCCHYGHGVSQLFPGNAELLNLKAQGYVGMVVRGNRGDLVGVLAVISRRPLPKPYQWREVLEILATRAAAEMERLEADEECRQLEEQAQYAQKVESLGVLVGGIAHDFNNILAAIMGQASLALMDLPPDAPLYGNLQQVNVAANRAAELVGNMLAYAGGAKPMLSPTDLDAIVREQPRLLGRSLPSRAHLSLQLGKNVPPVGAHVAQLGQILTSLIANAGEALGDAGGEICVRTGTMVCDRAYLRRAFLGTGLQEGRYAFFEVEDSGCGMGAETVTKIFDPFFSTKFQGRGLGLAAVLGIVRNHGGAIKVTSTSGKGSAFRVLLPALEAPVVEASKDAQVRPHPLGGGTVLLVDDDQILRETGSELLRRLGFRVVTAADGLQALQAFAEAPDQFDLVLLDLTMPHLDGEQCLRRLRRMRPHIRAILTTGYGERCVMDRFAGVELAGFLQKPYGLTELFNVLRSSLASASNAR